MSTDKKTTTAKISKANLRILSIFCELSEKSKDDVLEEALRDLYVKYDFSNVYSEIFSENEED